LTDVEVIVVGAELLKGERSDAHLAYLGRALQRFGARVAAAHIAADDIEGIAALLRRRIGKARVVIIAGGLGPTPDDVTREAIAHGVGRPLVFDEGAWSRICTYIEKRGYTATEVNRRQAYLPEGGEIIDNQHGTAPGFAVEVGGTTTFALPGPPREMQHMFERDVAARIEAIFGRPPLRVETYRTFGVGESRLVEWFGDVLDGLRAYEVSSLPWVTGVDIVLTARRDADDGVLDSEAERVGRALGERLGTKLYEHGGRPLAEVVGAELSRRGETVAIAESLTGGMVSTLLTDVPGSSGYFLADAVTYSNDSKVAVLGVDADAIASHGAVSEAVCGEMADGVRRSCGATWGLSTTGIAGPTGGSADKPVGLTYLGLAWHGGGEVKRRTFAGGRNDVRRKAAYGMLWLLYDRLKREGM
jgi:nicotinamide-nucleotide amidase